MNRTVIAAAGGAAGTLALAGVFAAGYTVGHSPTTARTITHPATHTVTVTAAPHVVTRWKTRTVTKAAGAPSVPCTDEPGASPAVQPGVVDPGVTQGGTACTVSVTPQGADHLGTITLTAPGGAASTYLMENPASGG
jgi:hypothetical protein